MAIKIAHFSIDENNRASGGAAGDQTSRECCVRDWYNKPWDYYIEITDEALANKAADLFTKVANRNEAGYDQKQRLTFYDALVECKGDVSKMKKCEADCSSGIASIYKFLGLNVNPSCTTRNIRAAFVATGKAKAYSDKEHTASDKYAKRGGLYLKEGSHVVMAIENGSSANSKPTSSPTTATTTTYTRKQFIKDVQACTGAKVDGIAGNETLSKTVTVSRSKNIKHAVVKPIQKYLNALGYNCGTPDGIAGAKFDAAVKAFQKANGCTVDGEITAKNKTWKKLLGLA